MDHSGVRGFWIWGLGFGVWVWGFGVRSSGFGVWGLGFGVWGLGFGVWCLVLRRRAVCKARCLGSGAEGSGFVSTAVFGTDAAM